MTWFKRALGNGLYVEAIDKEVKQFIKHIKNYGWDVRQKSKVHQRRAYCPCGQHQMPIPNSPSDHRWKINLTKTLNRMCPLSNIPD